MKRDPSHLPGAVRLTASGSHLELDVLAAAPPQRCAEKCLGHMMRNYRASLRARRSSDDTPPQISLEAMPHPVGDQAG